MCLKFDQSGKIFAATRKIRTNEAIFLEKKRLEKENQIPAKKWDNKYHAQLKTFSTIVSIWTSHNYEKQCNANVKILGSSLGTGLDDYLATELASFPGLPNF